ncbi:Protein of unknown function, partial [Gryllus bimaculatus]
MHSIECSSFCSKAASPFGMVGGCVACVESRPNLKNVVYCHGGCAWAGRRSGLSRGRRYLAAKWRSERDLLLGRRWGLLAGDVDPQQVPGVGGDEQVRHRKQDAARRVGAGLAATLIGQRLGLTPSWRSQWTASAS